jgi:hypothetical protein
MGLESTPDALRAFNFVTGSYLRGKQETGKSLAYRCTICVAQTVSVSMHVSTSTVRGQVPSPRAGDIDLLIIPPPSRSYLNAGDVCPARRCCFTAVACVL